MPNPEEMTRAKAISSMKQAVREEPATMAPVAYR